MTGDDQRIEHILNAITKIETVVPASEEEFLSSILQQDAVSYNFLIIGEAAGKVSLEMRSAHPEIPWRIMIGMRNILIHDYMQTDYKLMWQTIKHDLPELKKQLLSMISS